jgi:hypothetical protein
MGRPGGSVPHIPAPFPYFERTAGYYAPIAVGSCVAYSRSVPAPGEDCSSATHGAGLGPRIYERVHPKCRRPGHCTAEGALLAWT